MKYSVGQTVFLLDNSEMKIFPARIEEEIVRRRVGSELVTYKVSLPNKERTVVDLSELDVTVFISPDELRDHMAENARRTIDGLIERAKRVSLTFEQRNPGDMPGGDPVQDES